MSSGRGFQAVDLDFFIVAFIPAQIVERDASGETSLK